KTNNFDFFRESVRKYFQFLSDLGYEYSEVRVNYEISVKYSEGDTLVKVCKETPFPPELIIDLMPVPPKRVIYHVEDIEGIAQSSEDYFEDLHKLSHKAWYNNYETGKYNPFYEDCIEALANVAALHLGISNDI